jgi:hypothetical protein
MSDERTHGLPPDLAAVLRDQSVIVPQDAAVFEVIGKWAKAKSPTASANLVVETNSDLMETLRYQSQAGSSTTPAAC